MPAVTINDRLSNGLKSASRNIMPTLNLRIIKIEHI